MDGEVRQEAHGLDVSVRPALDGGVAAGRPINSAESGDGGEPTDPALPRPADPDATQRGDRGRSFGELVVRERAGLILAALQTRTGPVAPADRVLVEQFVKHWTNGQVMAVAAWISRGTVVDPLQR